MNNIKIETRLSFNDWVVAFSGVIIATFVLAFVISGYFGFMPLVYILSTFKFKRDKINNMVKQAIERGKREADLRNN